MRARASTRSLFVPPSSATWAKPKEFSVTPQFGQPKHLLYFDRFEVVKEDAFTELDFCDGRSSGGLVFRVTNESLQLQKKSFMNYFDEVGAPKSAAPERAKVKSPSSILFADLIQLARFDRTAEIVFHAISWKFAIDQTPESGGEGSKIVAEVPSFCLAILRSDIATQLHWLAALYEDEKE